jgi:RHS repeat-associated protein
VPGTNGGTTTFKYDPFGRRIQKSGPLGTANYLYEGMNSVEEVDDAGNELAGYIQGAGIDQPLAELRSGTTSFYDQDGLGSVTSLSNSTAAIASTYSYGSFGKLTASTGTLANPFQYTGREFDSETGIYFYRARYYDPTIGRFASEDPTGFRSDDLNFYRYVHNSSINYTDPAGLAKTYDCGAGCGFRIERDPHKGLHVNWWCNGLSGCLLIPSMQPCEVGRSDQPPSRITQCIQDKLKIPQPQPNPSPMPCPKRFTPLPLLPWPIIIDILEGLAVAAA